APGATTPRATTAPVHLRQGAIGAACSWSPRPGSRPAGRRGRRLRGFVLPRRAIEVEDARRADVSLGLVARDLADLPHDLRHALGLADDDVGGVVLRRARVEPPSQELGVPHDAGERLIELVRGGAGELGDDGLLLLQPQLLLRVREALLDAEPLAQIS